MDEEKITDEFLDTLIETAKTVGWTFDYCEICDFIRKCYAIADKKCPEERIVDPYE